MILRHSVSYEQTPDSIASAVSSLLSALVTMAKSEGVLSPSLEILHVRSETLPGDRTTLVTAFEINENERSKNA